MSNAITLARLPDDVEPFVLSNAYQNGVIIFKSINELYQDLDGLFYFGAPILTPISACPSDKHDRAAYLWINQAFSQLENELNGLISDFNTCGIVGKPNYTDTPLITLWRPQELSLDGYQAGINSNWATIETIVNNYYLWLEPFIKKGVS